MKIETQTVTTSQREYLRRKLVLKARVLSRELNAQKALRCTCTVYQGSNYWCELHGQGHF